QVGPLVSVYCDANWAGDVDDRRSTSGVVVLLYGAPIIWVSKKQSTVALSAAEAEYMSMSTALQELKWLRSLLSEVGFECRQASPVFTDN
ncbi:Ty1/Copia family ribonuclease HI, partial [Klebsiella pneumoniae]|nr:Ty1/Copia family ribonuclease HI [Klebsiella pneumoniae]